MTSSLPILEDDDSVAPVPLSKLRAGQSAQLLSSAQCSECDLLRALGLTDKCRFKVCKAGDPWIVQVQQTRIGLADSVADSLLVLPDSSS
jgi:Fe2+ transport system protein FeoA